MFLFWNAKSKRLCAQRLKASKLAWTALYRKAHKKDQSTDASRKKRRSTKATQQRSIVGVSLEVLQKRRNEKTDVRAAARDNALREIKERAKKEKEARAKAAAASSQAKAPKAQAPKQAGGMAKGSKSGGKR